MFGYIDVKKRKKERSSPELWQILPETPCIASVERMNVENWYYDNDRENSVIGENLSNSQAKESYPCTGLGRPLGFQQVEAPRISTKSAHEGGKVISAVHRPPLSPGDIPSTHLS